MDLTTAYCQTRRNLEELGWTLTSRHAALTGRLLRLVGGNHDVFLVMLDHCKTASLDILDSRADLQRHRRDHGC